MKQLLMMGPSMLVEEQQPAGMLTSGSRLSGLRRLVSCGGCLGLTFLKDDQEFGSVLWYDHRCHLTGAFFLGFTDGVVPVYSPSQSELPPGVGILLYLASRESAGSETAPPDVESNLKFGGRFSDVPPCSRPTMLQNLPLPTPRASRQLFTPLYLAHPRVKTAQPPVFGPGRQSMILSLTDRLTGIGWQN